MKRFQGAKPKNNEKENAEKALEQDTEIAGSSASALFDMFLL